jgi:hypothetical protein
MNRISPHLEKAHQQHRQYDNNPSHFYSSFPFLTTELVHPILDFLLHHLLEQNFIGLSENFI